MVQYSLNIKNMLDPFFSMSTLDLVALRKLVHETQVLEDADTLISCGLEDGSTVVVILENPGPIVLMLINT